MCSGRAWERAEGWLLCLHCPTMHCYSTGFFEEGVSASWCCALWQARDGESLCRCMTAQVVTPFKL